MRSTLKGTLLSFSFRIALLYVFFFLVSTLILFAFIYVTSTRSVTEQLDQTLASDKTAFIERYAQSGLNGLIRLVNSRVQSQGEDAAYSLVSDEAEVLAGNLARWPALPTLAPESSGLIEFSIANATNKGHSLFRGEIVQLPKTHLLLVARSKKRIEQSQRKLIQTYLWAALITLILGLVGGYLISKRAVRRIASINRLCRTIIDGDISQRLGVTNTYDDLDDLSNNINSMLDKIESLLGEIIHVSDSIAHDMRTPLSHLRLKLEKIQAQLPQNKKVHHQLSETITSTDSIIDTFNALLRISKIQASKRLGQFKDIDLASLIRDVVELYEPLAEDCNISVHSYLDKVTIQGDRDLLFQALANLLDNAIKYTPEKGNVHLSLTQKDNKVRFMISDDGPGVSEAELGQLSRRFYRVDSSRSQPGNGLGLSLVEAITKAHKASLIFSINQPTGLCVELIFNRK